MNCKKILHTTIAAINKTMEEEHENIERWNCVESNVLKQHYSILLFFDSEIIVSIFPDFSFLLLKDSSLRENFIILNICDLYIT